MEVKGSKARLSTFNFQPSTFSIIVLCCGWIIATAAARSAVTLATDDQAHVLSGGPAVAVAVCLVAGTILLSGVLPVNGPRRADAGRTVACVIFAVAVSSLLAQGRLTQWDALAAFLSLAGIELFGRGANTGGPAARGTWGWAGVLLLGTACGCSPLCLGVLVPIVFAPGTVWRRVVGFVVTVGLGLGVALMIDTMCDRPIGRSLALSGVAARIGSQDVWRLAARWSDQVMPALVLALAAASSWLLDDDADAEPAGGCEKGFSHQQQDSHQQRDSHQQSFDKALTVWMGINLVAGIMLPRVVVDHGLLLVLPAFLLAPTGWRMLRHLPFDRSRWMLSMFGAACYMLPFALLWIPLQEAGQVMLVALFHT
ncbi:MAG: hypothetical protein V3W34_16085 [Phycisphaerae bacterium]